MSIRKKKLSISRPAQAFRTYAVVNLHQPCGSSDLPFAKIHGFKIAGARKGLEGVDTWVHRLQNRKIAGPIHPSPFCSGPQTRNYENNYRFGPRRGQINIRILNGSQQPAKEKKRFLACQGHYPSCVSASRCKRFDEKQWLKSVCWLQATSLNWCFRMRVADHFPN